ncbi:MAG: alpha/beta fold hydrolase [Chitinivibrionales bacterium]|nr:alpha/beta fold hydrolase [Chitinivibrionales bacterium]MBD3396266.1 alpha/beta fold hydrolase [Chitinivibrionales bacterium]
MIRAFLSGNAKALPVPGGVARGLLLLMSSISLGGCFVRSSLYPAPNVRVAEPPVGFEEVVLSLSSGQTVSCWHLLDPALPETAPALLYLHGNGENLETMRLSGTLESLVNLKMHVLALDYPGYGKSGGKPSEESLAEACDSALAWLAGQYATCRRIVCGWSLGAAAGIGVAARNPGSVDGLIAMSAWTSLVDVASRFYPWFLVKLLVRDQYNSLAAIGKVTCPVLLVHGRQDSLIPAQQGQKLSRAAPRLQRFVTLPGVQHNDLLGRRVVWAEIRKFVGSIPPPKDRPHSSSMRSSER